MVERSGLAETTKAGMRRVTGTVMSGGGVLAEAAQSLAGSVFQARLAAARMTPPRASLSMPSQII